MAFGDGYLNTKASIKILVVMTIAISLFINGCGDDKNVSEKEHPEVSISIDDSSTEVINEAPEIEQEDTDAEEYTEGYGDTLIISDEEPDTNTDEQETTEEPEVKKVDLIMFMGQSNMSGCGGNSPEAPFVPESAGIEFRAVSDPTQLYPIREPFGLDENNINGLFEKPGGKAGSLVSAFINEYYKDTEIPVVAVSASRGEMAMYQWLSDDVVNDVVTRFKTAKEWLLNNGYSIEHMYMIWLQGESDGLRKTDGETYKTQMDDFIRPLFIEGLQQVFIITPGRTIDETEIYTNIINTQKDMCRTSGYYCLATNVLSGVSTEYMKDIYHYNQHVLNMVGIQAAKSVAYYTKTGHDPVLYDYKSHELFIPDDSRENADDAIGEIDLSNINDVY